MSTSSNIIDEQTECEPSRNSPSLKLEKLKDLRKRMADASKANRQDVIQEHQRNKTNPREEKRAERKQKEAEILLARKEAEENNEDYERSRWLSYSAEEVEKYEKKMSKKSKRANPGFSDYTQAAQRKYKKLMKNIKPDRESYEEQKDAATYSAATDETDFYRGVDSLAYAAVENRPKPENVDKMVQDLNKQLEVRSKLSRRRRHDDGDVTYINDRNMRFNKKISRAYDKYTKEIRDSFERGTAL